MTISGILPWLRPPHKLHVIQGERTGQGYCTASGVSSEQAFVCASLKLKPLKSTYHSKASTVS